MFKVLSKHQKRKQLVLQGSEVEILQFLHTWWHWLWNETICMNHPNANTRKSPKLSPYLLKWYWKFTANFGSPVSLLLILLALLNPWPVSAILPHAQSLFPALGWSCSLFRSSSAPKGLLLIDSIECCGKWQWMCTCVCIDYIRDQSNKQLKMRYSIIFCLKLLPSSCH